MRRTFALTVFGGLSCIIATNACASASESVGTNGASNGDGYFDLGGAGGEATLGAGGSGSVSIGAGGAAKGGAATTSGVVTSVSALGTSDAVCSAQSIDASAGALDVFIMLDRSKSMTQQSAGGTKWDVISDALEDFVEDPASAGISAGIGFFGLTADMMVKGSAHDTTLSSCSAADYAKPVVPVALLGGGAENATKITSAIEAVTPGSNTPTEPALQGALQYAASWAKQHSTHKVIVVFATDGLPMGCDSSVSGAVKIAATGVSATAIQTYVIGVFGDQDCPGGVTKGQECDVVTNTNQIAKGGGTGSAFIVNASASTGSQFLSALKEIRAANQRGCDLSVPAPAKGKAIDFSRASVRYTPAGGKAVTLPWKTSAKACDAHGGWYYDSDTKPGHVSLCETSCSAVLADGTAKVDLELACEPPGTDQGAGGASNGGAPGAGGAGTGGAGECLLAGQSCSSPAECCGGLCTNGICASSIR
jgi:hypothetical protein